MTFMMYVFCDSVCIGCVCVQTVTHPVEYNSLFDYLFNWTCKDSVTLGEIQENVMFKYHEF